jgi:hypothetical protein
MAIDGDEPPLSVPADSREKLDAASMRVTRAFVPDVFERTRRFAIAPRTQRDRVADERACAERWLRDSGADAQRSSFTGVNRDAMK